MKSQEFEELINNCHSNSSIELPIELKDILKELHQTEMTVKTLREKQLSMFKELNTDEHFILPKKMDSNNSRPELPFETPAHFLNYF